MNDKSSDIVATFVGVLIMIVVAVAVYFVTGLAHARPNEAWAAQKAQAESYGDMETLRRLNFLGKAGMLPCPIGSETWCQPEVGVHQNCCGEADAYEADEVLVEGEETWAVLTCNDPQNCQDVEGKVHRSPGEKFRVPPSKVLLNHDPINTTGHGWVYISPSSTDEEGRPVVFCWAAPAGL